MAEGVQIAAFEGGLLRTLASGDTSHEAVLALPLNRLLVKMVRVPAENREDPVAFAMPILQAMSPYPDEPLTVSCETVRDTDDGLVVIAAALPESATDDIGEALDGAKLNVTRIDALAIGALRGLWNVLGTDDGARRIVLLNGVDCISVIVLDGDSPSAIRAVNAASVLKREIMWSLLEAEDFGGAKPLKEIVLAESPAPEKPDDGDSENEAAALPQLQTAELEAFAPVRKVEIGEDAALVGVAERSADENALNALPDSWREMLNETRFKAKMVKHIAIAGGIWAFIMAVIFGVPFTFGLMTNHQKQLSKEHARKYQEVKDMRDKVKLVQTYSDHARGALEMMKAVSDRLPAEITLTSWSFRRQMENERIVGGLKVSGESEDREAVYAFTDTMTALSAGEGEDAETIFGKVVAPGPSAGKAGKQKFDIDCLYEKEGEE